MGKKIIHNVKIEKVGFGGVGISHTEEGKTILVSGGVLPGMIVDVKVLKKKKDFIQGQAVKIVNSEKGIVNSDINDKGDFFEINGTKVCKHNFIFDSLLHNNPASQSGNPATIGCGGCKWQILPYEEQLNLKEQVVKDSFAGCDFFNEIYEGIVGCDKIFNYRNKMEFSFGKYVVTRSQEKKVKEKVVLSNWSLGFHKQGQFSKIVDISNCLIAGEKINQVFSYLKNILKNSGLPVYDNYDHSGFFRHLVIREGINTNQVLVNLSVATKFLDKNKDKISLWTKLQNNLLQDGFLKENVSTFLFTENNGLADIVKGQDIKITPLRGPGYIFEELRFKEVPLKFRVSAFSFFQTNTLQAQKLFQEAINMLPNIRGNVLDLYCGAGTIGLTLLKLGIGEKLVGVEIVEDAVKDAWINAKINNLSDKVEFIADKAENINFKAKNIGLIVVDPPRSGLHKNVIEFLSNLKKEKDFKLLYISCNPVTMARDLKMLSEKGFDVKKLKAVDMFPHTHHIEMVGFVE